MTLALSALSAAGQQYVNSELPWHPLALDAGGKLVAWHGAEGGNGYDEVLHLAWDYMEHKAADDKKTGLKVYLLNSVFDPATGQGIYWQHNPASTYGQFVDSLVAWYPYSGDEEAGKVVRTMLDYQLAHGTTPADWDWPGVPFATSCGNDTEYGRCLQDVPREYYGGIETDKVGELGIGYVLFYEFSGDRKYLEAGIRCADALAHHIRPGDETHTPWPFRVEAKSGATIDRNEYGGMIVASVRLFDELIRLKQGDISKYAASRKTAWEWLLKYPIRNDRWVGYFEDVPHLPDDANQALPMMTAYYILNQKDPSTVDRQWIGDVGHMIDLVRRHYGRGPFFGAWAIDEQGGPPEYTICCSRAGLASDTSRWGAINALYRERAHDGQSGEDAFRSLNYATYFAASDGKVSCCGLDYDYPYWWDDGYGDYIRNFLWGMGAMPELAPAGQDHILRSTSVVNQVEYRKGSIRYKTFDADSTEVIRLSFRPLKVAAGGKELPLEASVDKPGFTLSPLHGTDILLRVHHADSQEVVIH
jgi:hypothetical protein